MQFDTAIAPIWILISAVLIVALLIYSFQRINNLIPKKDQWLLFGLRIVALLLLSLLALNPYVIERTPDAKAFHVAMLSDVSGSMHLADTRGKLPRLDVASDAFNHSEVSSLAHRLGQQYDLRLYTFADDILPGFQTPFSVQPGLTAIGDSLASLNELQKSEKTHLGSVVLLTDGISLQGESVFEVAKRYRELEIPINVIGIGEQASLGDVRIQFTDTPKKVTMDDSFTVKVVVENTFNQDEEITIGLFERNGELSRQTIQVAANSKQEVLFTVPPTLPGIHVFRARILNSVKTDLNPTNDIDFFAVEVTEPEHMEILYLGASMNYNYRFLKMTLREDPQLKLKSVIKLGPEKLFWSGFDEQVEAGEQPQFPETEAELFQHSALIVETGVFQHLTDKAKNNIKNYLDHRGGGVLFWGTPEEVSEELLPILPVRKTIALRSSSDQFLDLDAEPAFRDALGGTLFAPPGLYLAKSKVFNAAEELSRGARTLLATRNEGAPIMALQAYGAGRVVYLGTSNTWRWRMDSNRGKEQHELFWRYLLTWLSNGGKPRTELPLQGTVQSIESPVKLDLTVRGQDFRLSEDARVSATITTPDGQVLPPQTLIAEVGEPGIFGAVGELDKPGEYRVDYTIDFPEGDSLKQQAYFVGAFTGKENTDLRFRESELRDVARITGGTYESYRDINSIDSVNISTRVPLLEHKQYWTRNALFLIILLAVVGIEWFLRRRIGLK